MFFNMHKDNFSRSEMDELFTLEDLKSSLSEVLDDDKIFVIDLAIFIEEINKRCQYLEDMTKEDTRVIKSLWDSFDTEKLLNIRQTTHDEQIKKVITKMLVLKNAYKRVNEELMSMDLEDYFIPRERLIEIAI